jgi:hypothetical protein
MANTKISALTSATTPLAGTEVLPIVQSGATVKVAVSDLTAGRGIAATSLTTPIVQAANSSGLALKNSGGTTQLSLGAGGGDNITLSVATSITDNIIQGTAGKGINFTANTPSAGMTSELLNWYEEGTWTPVPTPGGGAFVLVGTVAGIYTRIGRTVTATARVTITNIGTGTGQIDIAGLPFTAGSPTNIAYFTGCGMQTATFKSLAVWIAAGSSTVSAWYYDQSTPLANGQGVYITIQYTV